VEFIDSYLLCIEVLGFRNYGAVCLLNKISGSVFNTFFKGSAFFLEMDRRPQIEEGKKSQDKSDRDCFK